ncbi:MAG: hypothetical protein ACM3ML_09800 [Micromonosporaceae bacterium]
MIRNALRAATLLLATLAIPAAILAAPLPANASPGHLCETYDPTSYCLGSANLNLYTWVRERIPGRDLTQSSLGGTFEGHPTYLLKFSADTSKCVAVSNDLAVVEIRQCNGGTGTVWARVTSSSGVYMWINRYATNSYGADLYLSGIGIQDRQYAVEPIGVWYQRFSWH